MIITYCYGWSRHGKRPSEIMTESRARKAYKKRMLYTALIGDPIRPNCFIESNRDYIGVEFLDNYLRNYVAYQFVEVQPGKLFLKMMILRKYDGDLDVIKEGTSYIIDPNGKLIRRHQAFPTNEQPSHEHLGTLADVSEYCEPFPSFGEYDGLIQTRPVPAIAHGSQ